MSIDIYAGMDFDTKHKHGKPWEHKYYGGTFGMSMTIDICAGMDFDIRHGDAKDHACASIVAKHST